MTLMPTVHKEKVDINPMDIKRRYKDMKEETMEIPIENRKLINNILYSLYRMFKNISLYITQAKLSFRTKVSNNSIMPMARVTNKLDAKIKKELNDNIFSTFNLLQILFLKANPTFKLSKSLRPRLTKKTLVLDLDETLIHSTLYNLKLPDYTIEVINEKRACLYYVYKRPHLDTFLRKVRNNY